MNPLKRALAFDARRTSDVIYAKIKERLSNGQYRCSKITDKAEIIASRANPQDEFLTGTWVVISYLGASKTTIGGGYVIISRAPHEQRGLAGLSPSEDETVYERPTISAIEPDPVVLRQGGGAKELDVFGTGFLHSPEDYGDPGISDFLPPVVGVTDLQLSVRAADSVAVGLYDLTYEGVVAKKKAVRVIVPGPPPSSSLWVVGYDADYAPELVRFDAATMEEYSRHHMDDLQSTTGVVVVGDYAYFRGYDQMMKIHTPSDLESSMIVGLQGTQDNVDYQLSGTSIFYPLYGVDALGVYDTLTDVETVVGSLGFVSLIGLQPDGSSIWVCSDLGIVFEVDAATGTVLQYVSDAVNFIDAVRVRTDTTHVYLLTRTTLRKLLKSDLSIVSSVAVGLQCREMKWYGGALMITGTDVSGVGYLWRADPATMTITNSCALSARATGFDFNPALANVAKVGVQLGELGTCDISTNSNPSPEIIVFPLPHGDECTGVLFD